MGKAGTRGERRKVKTAFKPSLATARSSARRRGRFCSWSRTWCVRVCVCVYVDEIEEKEGFRLIYIYDVCVCVCVVLCVCVESHTCILNKFLDKAKPT
jgi:hypothetical protein